MAWTTPKTWVPGEIPSAQDFNTHIRDNLRGLLPLGTLIYRIANVHTVETVVENRWLECNGVAVSRTIYADLYAYLLSLAPSLSFGTGDGSTTFNLPDFRGRMPVSEGPHADVTLGDNEGRTVDKRKPKHFHDFQYGADSLGGSWPLIGAFDTVITGTKPTTPATSVADRANHPQDAPAHLVAGVWFVKFTA